MTHVVQLTDLHLVAGDPERERPVRATVAAVAALDPQPECVLVTGDLTDSGSLEDARRAAELLGVLAPPVHVIPGNHDDRAALREAFAVPGDGPLSRTVTVGDLRLVLCDTPTLVALHHPPIRVGVAAMDALMLDGGDCDALAAVLDGRAGVLTVVCGHVHRATAGALGAVPVRTAPSAWRQLALDFTAGDALADISLADEPPGYALHRYAGGGLTTHTVSVV